MLLTSGTLLALLSQAPTTPPQVLDVPRFAIGTKEDLLDALGTPTYHEGEIFPRSAMIAMEGRRVLPWLLEIIADSSERPRKRMAAVRVLEYSLDSPAVPTLLRVVTDSTAPHSVRIWIVMILRVFPYESVCSFWRDVLAVPIFFAKLPGEWTLDAVVGLSYCGNDNDRSLIEPFFDPRMTHAEHTVGPALRRLAKPRNERFRGTRWEDFPFPSGAYVPTRKVAGDIVRIICGKAPCPDRPIPADAPGRRW